MDRACVMKEPRIFEIQYKKRSVLTRGDLYGCFSGSYADKLGSIFSEYTFWARDSLYLSFFYKTLKVVLTYETIDVFLWPSFCFCLILTSTDYKPCYIRPYQVVTNVPKETAPRFDYSRGFEDCVYSFLHAKYPNNQDLTEIRWLDSSYVHLKKIIVFPSTYMQIWYLTPTFRALVLRQREVS